MSFSSAIGLFRILGSRFRTAIFEPQLDRFPSNIVRAALRRRRVFDMLSLTLQLLDIRRLNNVAATVNQDDPNAAAYAHNARVLLNKFLTRTRRMEDVYRVAAVIQPNVPDAVLLSIGPRNVHELLLAWLYGFTWRNIHGVDLYSTNRKIQVMDMEHMAFPDASFDVIVMSRTLSYAKDVGQCIREVARVLKPSGLFCFTATYAPGLNRFPNDHVPGTEVVSRLKEAGFDLRYYRPREKNNTAGLRQVAHVFCVTKIDPTIIPFDPIPFLCSAVDRPQAPPEHRGLASRSPTE